MKLTALAITILAATAYVGPAQAHQSGASKSNGTVQFDLMSNHRHVKAAPHVEPYRVKRPAPRIRQLSPRKITRSLRKQGYINIHNMRTDGRIYRVDARGYRGNLVRLTVSAKSGKVIKRKMLSRLRPVDRRSFRANYGHWTPGFSWSYQFGNNRGWHH